MQKEAQQLLMVTKTAETNPKNGNPILKQDISLYSPDTQAAIAAYAIQDAAMAVQTWCKTAYIPHNDFTQKVNRKSYTYCCECYYYDYRLVLKRRI